MSQRHRMYVSNNVPEDEYEHSNTREGGFHFVKGIEKFTNGFHKSISNDQEKNFVSSSALSVHVVLSMCAYGAKEKTAEEMKSALHLPANICWESFKYLLKTMNDSSEIGIANKLLIDKNIVVRDSYKEAMESLFHSEITEVDFVNDGRNIIRYYHQKNSHFVFVIIKPNKIDGLKFIENNLEKINLNYKEDFKINSSKDYTEGYTHTNKNIFYVNLSLPKFKIETTIDLKKNLIKLGMPTMFTDKANFKDISIKPVLVPRLHVSEVIQKACIIVNEEGTEAVAVTRLSVSGGGSVEIQEFKVDRPFLYRIVHKSTNVTLFSGCVFRPKY
ncbi:hypothetical protein TSAR_016907 [Trichomalopsis sarcophagae]|uniref:Serpin domain-containing protein n=1 Tax=Trichomalopsis sarcophagae TaxID=543379 RepID=A0A232F5Y5_9HYME|nr:hypothetical protein TSAR_016907 [Trichomalopsis sarcophagae]